MAPSEKKRLIDLLEKKEKLKHELPHLHGFKLLPFQKQWIDSTHRFNVISAGNQIGKSSSNIMKAIHWATATELWNTLWKKKPLMFWYLYPDGKTATSEFENKWIPEFLPKGVLKDHSKYGWKAKYRQGQIYELRFNSGVVIQFRYYSQGLTNLQAGSVHAIFCDEELPFNLFGELRLRLIANDGYFHLVCTPTLGQEEWARVLERNYLGTDEELLKENEVDIFKTQVSMYDCLNYADGTPSHITIERIKEVEGTLTDREIQVRVYGRFMMEEGLKYSSFDKDSNVVRYHPLPFDKWDYYCGIDWGGGGASHPSGMVVVAVNKKFTKARVVWAWISKGEETTAGDVLDKYRYTVLRKFKITRCFYDFSCKDLGTLATRAGVSMEKADKSHDIGVPLINTLFKTKALKIMNQPEFTGDTEYLISELMHLLAKTAKRNANDTLADGLRYAISRLMFAMEIIKKSNNDDEEIPKSPKKELTRRSLDGPKESNYSLLINEFNEWNEYYESEFI